MKKNFLPICSYPTRKIILDDDNIFSESILLKMDGKHFSSYESPHCLLDYLLNKYDPILTQADFFNIEQTSPEALACYNFYIPTNKLNSAAENRIVNDISVILIDYHMPDMTGIDFVNRIKNLPFKKILITGEQDYAIGINALNAGLIDAYVRKDDPDLLNIINKLVRMLEWQYFTELSASAYTISEFDYLKNDFCIGKFSQLISEKKIETFFLTNKEGDFTGFNDEREKSFIMFRNRKQLQELSVLAKEDDAPNEIINRLARFEVVPFFGDKQHWEIPATKWYKFLYPANHLADDSDFVWAVITPS